MDMKIEHIRTLLSIVPAYPGVGIYHISDHEPLLSLELTRFCEERGYSYDLMVPDMNFLEVLREEGIAAEAFDLRRPRYNRHAKLYDFLFVTLDPLRIEAWPLFLKKLYMIMKNGAKLLLFLPLQEPAERYEALLEAGNFVAINPIDLFDDYQLLSAQKMHGWGIYDLR